MFEAWRNPTLRVPEEDFDRNGVDEPLEKFIRSLPAVVDFGQFTQQYMQFFPTSIRTLLLRLKQTISLSLSH